MSAPISASGSAAGATPSQISPTVALAALALAALAVRLLAGAIAPLSEDEAYYRLWSMQPAFGYFDHPPMIAWWTWAGRQIAGDTPLGVRLLPSLGASLTTLATYALAREAGLSERVALRAAVWLNATLLIGLGGQLAVPDAPGTLFWTLALWFAFKAVKGRGAWWLAVGVAAGLGCLSKYSALFLAPGIGLWLLLWRDGRKALASPWPWLGGVIAMAIFTPNIAWNAQHGWMTFDKQFGRVTEGELGAGYLGKLLVDQFVLLNPLIAVFVGLAVRRRIAWPLLATASPFVAYLLVHSLHGEVQGQWPAPLYPSLAIAGAAAAEGASGWLGRLRWPASRVGLAVCAIALAYTAAPLDGLTPFPDLGRSYRGWPAFGAALERERLAVGAAWLGAPTYGQASLLAAAPQLHAPATEIFERERYSFETPSERADFSRPGLVVGMARRDPGAVLQTCFVTVHRLGRLDRGLGQSATSYVVYEVAGPRRDVERVGCARPLGAKF